VPVCDSDYPVCDSDDSSARHEIEDEDDEGENQQDVNPASQRVAADESHDPEDEEDNRNCPKHFRSSYTIAGFASPVRSDMCNTGPYNR
jgi:hypothetical protein